MAKVIPVYKKGSPLKVSNYLPISLYISIFNKILVRLIYNRLIKYFEQSSIFFDPQFGFRSNHSTVHALTLMVDKIQKPLTVGIIPVVFLLIYVRPLILLTISSCLTNWNTTVSGRNIQMVFFLFI